MSRSRGRSRGAASARATNKRGVNSIVIEESKMKIVRLATMRS